MNNILKYYYNFNVDDIKEYDNYSIFNYDNNLYIFKKYNNDLDTTKYIIDFLYKNNIKIHRIIINKDNNLLTKYKNNDYILIQVIDNKLIDDLIINIPIKELKDIIITDLWSKKLDNYMLNLNELGLNKKVLIDTFNYYIGLGENAISLYNDALEINENINYYVCHKRMIYPNYGINFLDPTNMIIDYRIRDIAEYIKYKFFYNNFTIDELDNIINKYKLTYKEMHLLYSRLFYPTYYFDIFEDNIINDNESKMLITIYEKRTLFEKFLYDIYLKYKSNFNLNYVDWLAKVQH